MKKLLKVLIVCASIVFTFTACKPSTEKLTEMVKVSMQESYDEDGMGVQVLELNLVHKGGNEYTGLAKLTNGEDTVQADVNVVADGDSFQWETDVNE